MVPQFRIFVIGKDLWGHIDSTTVKPTDTTKSTKWVIYAATIISWILSSVEQHIVFNLWLRCTNIQKDYSSISINTSKI